MSNRVNISADMINWAILRAGYEFHEFAQKLPVVAEWLEGTKKPTIKQLETFAKKAHVPFGYLFLPTPPIENIPIPYFRSNSRTNDISVNIYDTIQIMLRRQDWLKEYLIEEGFAQLPFVARYHNRINTERNSSLSTEGSQNDILVQQIVSDIRDTLGLHENWASNFRTWEETLNQLVEVIEDKGIIVSFNGVVDNNTSRKIDVDECRGFVLVDNYAPFMFVNNGDSKSAQMFTIVHELAHIWTGHSAGFDFRKLQPADDPVEKLCDKIAAEFLVPQYAFNEIWDGIDNIRKCTRHFKVSEIVIARRALDLHKITKRQFFEFYEEYISREFSKPKGSGGNFYATAQKRLSKTFAIHIERAVKSGNLLYRDAYKLTSMKGNTFNTFFTKQLNG